MMDESPQHTTLVSDKHPLISLLIILGLVAFGFVLFGPAIGLLFASFIYDGDLMQALTNPDRDFFFPLMVIQGSTSLIGLIVIPLSYVALMERKRIGAFFRKESQPLIFVVLLFLGVCFIVAISPVIEWNMNFEFPESLKSFGEWARQQEDSVLGLTKLLTEFKSPAEFMLGLLVIAIIPGIGEELVFRGLIQNELNRASRNIHVAIWLSAFLFSAIHMQFFGFVPRLLLGALFGYLYYWSGNLLVPMVAHFIHNGFTLTMIYLYQIGTIDVNMDSEESAPWSAVLICFSIATGMLYYIYTYYRQSRDENISTS